MIAHLVLPPLLLLREALAQLAQIQITAHVIWQPSAALTLLLERGLRRVCDWLSRG